MEALLKASEASALMGVSMRHVRRMAQSGALSYQIHMNAQNRPEYLFPLSSLPDAAQQKYFAEHVPAALPAATPAKAKKADKPAAVCKPLEAYTAEERGEIGYWITTVDRWQTYRNKAGTKKAECDEKFVLLCRMEEPDRQISVETLYRKWAAIREGDYGALVDMRGKARKGMSKMPEAIERVFLSLFLDESQLPVPRCIALTEEWAQQNIRDKVVPELDAFRFASYCGISGVTKKEETLADGAATVAALSAAVTAMDDEEVTATGRYLFITPTLLQGINDMDTTKSKKVLEGFERVIKVPQRRFYTAIKQLSGKTGEEAGGYTKAAGAANINFAIVQKDALIQYTKHAAPKIIAPENNPDADAYVFGYRMVGIAKAYKNMLSGMYFSHDKA